MTPSPHMVVWWPPEGRRIAEGASHRPGKQPRVPRSCSCRDVKINNPDCNNEALRVPSPPQTDKVLVRACPRPTNPHPCKTHQQPPITTLRHHLRPRRHTAPPITPSPSQAHLSPFHHSSQSPETATPLLSPRSSPLMHPRYTSNGCIGHIFLRWGCVMPVYVTWERLAEGMRYGRLACACAMPLF